MFMLCEVRRNRTKYVRVSEIDRNCQPATFLDLWMLCACAVVVVAGSVVLWVMGW